MNKYTSGPWNVGESHGSGRIEILEGDTKRFIRKQVCIVLPHGEFDAPGELEANARLIAAAPDLLDAADNALGVLIASCIPAGGVDDRKAILDAQQQLRQALKKAEGK